MATIVNSTRMNLVLHIQDKRRLIKSITQVLRAYPGLIVAIVNSVTQLVYLDT